MNVINFVTANWVAILAIVTSAFVAADKFVKLTPTKKDDELLGKVEDLLAKVGIKIPPSGL